MLRERFFKLISKKKTKERKDALLIELFPSEKYCNSSVFLRKVEVKEGFNLYRIFICLSEWEISLVRKAVSVVSDTLDPELVKPLTFERLVEVIMQEVSPLLSQIQDTKRLREVSELAAYECIGLSRFYAFATDNMVTEFFCDSRFTPIYLDHLEFGRCETEVFLTERERDAIETHLDTFGGYSLDFRTPSLKHDIEVSGRRLRVSLDLEPLAVNGFSLDVRRLDPSGLGIRQLISMRTLTPEAASFLTAWAELGGNVCIVGETGSGKTTLMNAIDRELNPKLRRVYIEDAVETPDLLKDGYHQLKLRVEPYDKSRSIRTKEFESVKMLHRSPDIMILSEIQSEEHNKALFSSLESGIRGLQTFHASSLEQAIRRWRLLHGISETALQDLGLLVQMSRPDRLKPTRLVSRISQVSLQDGEPLLVDIFQISGGKLTRNVAAKIVPPPGKTLEEFYSRVAEKMRAFEINEIRNS